LDDIVTRAGGWLFLTFLCVFAAGMAADSGFAVHMMICAAAATIAAFYTLRQIGRDQARSLL
jgi:cytochrome c oxidase cbb3-type subunit 1